MAEHGWQGRGPGEHCDMTHRKGWSQKHSTSWIFQGQSWLPSLRGGRTVKPSERCQEAGRKRRGKKPNKHVDQGRTHGVLHLTGTFHPGFLHTGLLTLCVFSQLPGAYKHLSPSHEKLLSGSQEAWVLVSA